MPRGVRLTPEKEEEIIAALETIPHASRIARELGDVSFATVWRVAERAGIELTAGRAAKGRRLAAERRAKIVEALRANVKATQAEVARETGVSRSTVGRIARGSRNKEAESHAGYNRGSSSQPGPGPGGGRTTENPDYETPGQDEKAGVRVIFTRYRTYLLAPDEQGVPVEQYFQGIDLPEPIKGSGAKVYQTADGPVMAMPPGWGERRGPARPRPGRQTTRRNPNPNNCWDLGSSRRTAQSSPF